MIGQTIAHYSIVEKLGEGGMGVVYKARDTKLNRDVALKFLPPQLASSEGDRARFIQEAQSAAALNHPNVCSVMDIQEHDTSDGKQMFIVMEFVDGQTLRSRMSGKAGAPPSAKQAIEIGIQIADGLAAAHEKGIVHRDIKPENIMIRRDGIVQVMDFGLAKLRGTATRLTKQGSTVGTAGYMSPEQVQGLDVDHRSDIFSLGVLLYEMFTGQLPFRGVHETALAYEIVNVDPAPMSSVRSDIDPALDAIVLDCMEKDPRERCQSVAEVARDLRRVKRESSRQRVSRVTASRPAYTGQGQPPTPGSGYAAADGQPTGSAQMGAQGSGTMAAPGSGAMAVPGSGMFAAQGSGTMAVGAALPGGTGTRGSSRTAWIVAATFLLTTVAAVAWHFYGSPPAETRVVESLILPPDKSEFNTQVGGHLSISPDGETVAFVAIDSTGMSRLWARQLRSLEAMPLQGTDEASYPFWSPDSRTIAFFSRGKLKKIDARGGPTVTICDAPDGRGGSWGSQGVILFSAGPYNPLSRVPAAGGTPVEVTKLDTARNELSHRWPFFLPDGDHYLFVNQTAASATDSDAVYVASLAEGSPRPLFHGNSNMAYASGRLLFLRQSTLMAQPFDAGKLEFTGEAVPIAERIQYNPARSRGIYSVSGNGVLVFQSGEAREPEIGLFNRSGQRIGLLGEPGALRLNFSPDGKKIAYDRQDPQTGTRDIWVLDITRKLPSRFTFDAASDMVPVWSPRGDSIVFSSNRGGRFHLYIKNASGTGDENLVAGSTLDLYPTSWSKDGRLLSVSLFGDPSSHIDLFTVPMTGERKAVPFLNTTFNEWVGRYSPDGRWIAYQSDETGKYEIYVRFADGSGGKWQISSGGGTAPRWTFDGNELLYSTPDRKVVSAHLNGRGSTMVVDSLSVLFDYESNGIVGGLDDISPDGKTILARVLESRGAVSPVTLVVNWDEKLRKN